MINSAVSLLINPWFSDSLCKMSKMGWLESGGLWKTSINQPGANKGNPGACRTAIKWHSIDGVPAFVTGKLCQTIVGSFSDLSLQYWYVSLGSQTQGEINVYALTGNTWARILSTSYGGHLKTWRQSSTYFARVPSEASEIMVEATAITLVLAE